MVRRSPLALRRTLVNATVALITLAALVIGLVSVVSVQNILIGRIDGQLNAATSRSSDALGHTPRGAESAPQFITTLGQSVGTLGAIKVNGEVVAGAYLDSDLDSPSLDVAQLQSLQDAHIGTDPVTVNVGRGLSGYRLAAVKVDEHVSIIVGLPLTDVEATISQLLLVVLAITVIALLVSGSGAYALVRLTLRPLDRVAATATEVSNLTLDRGDVALGVRVAPEDADGSSEVGRVGQAINRMLEHVANALTVRQQSEDKVRRFVSDASHELRTPLASIRGYTELTRLSGEEIPTDARYALGRIESESKRMTAIVEDLLLLARLDEGRQLESEPVDLAELAADAVSDARAASADHHWNAELPEDPVMVCGDRQRLFQAILNLHTNARVHTLEGTTVTTALTSDHAAGVAVLSVVDDGPGIEPELLEQVFERFVRGDASRTRSTGSTGLGLAIVQSVVAAHDGTSSVTSEPGRTEFTLTLPLRS